VERKILDKIFYKISLKKHVFRNLTNKHCQIKKLAVFNIFSPFYVEKHSDADDTGVTPCIVLLILKGWLRVNIMINHHHRMTIYIHNVFLVSYCKLF
jgi:hypothetical protein